MTLKKLTHCEQLYVRQFKRNHVTYRGTSYRLRQIMAKEYGLNLEHVTVRDVISRMVELCLKFELIRPDRMAEFIMNTDPKVDRWWRDRNDPEYTWEDNMLDQLGPLISLSEVAKVFANYRSPASFKNHMKQQKRKYTEIYD